MDYSFIGTICQVNAEWKFNKADLMDLMKTENGYLNGKSISAFNIPGVRYLIRIFPNGKKKGQRGKSCIIFSCYGFGDCKIAIEITLSIGSSHVKEIFNSTDESDASDDKYFCDTSKFFDPKNNYFVNGELTIKTKGIIKVEHPRVSKISTPISMRWKINEADLKTVMDESNDAFLCSKKLIVASFSGVKYYLAIYPNQILNNGNEPETILYLLLDRGNETYIEMNFEVYVDSAKYSSAMQDYQSKFNGIGFRLCSTTDLFDASKKFIVDGYLTVNMNGLLMKEKKQCVSVSIFRKNGVASKSAFEKNDKDCLILVGHGQIAVHKQVLMDASPVLAEMLEFGMEEPAENELVIEDFSFKIVQAAIKLCYRRNGPRKYIFEEMLTLYEFAKKYRIQFILDSIEDYLIEEVSPLNVVCLIKFAGADNLNVPKLYQSCIDFVIKCSKDSTPIYASECLDEKLLAEMYLKTLHSSGF